MYEISPCEIPSQREAFLYVCYVPCGQRRSLSLQSEWLIPMRDEAEYKGRVMQAINKEMGVVKQ